MLNVPRQRKSTAEQSQDGNHWKASKGVAKGVVHVTVIVEASAPQGRAPSRRPHPCHPFVVLRCVPAPARATSAARPRPPLSLTRLRGSGSRLGRAVSRGGAEPRARRTPSGAVHPASDPPGHG
ncbi:hypothetical protein Ctob_001472 [Chrysochromulina tobinii]|uniref:Uncharacterized protein n=1 Tax=Chrysochromulina tobinii TaxID=1460289 RepID=A0A0M0J895_9EUKA|nr:hypothetical protein Ctob_001472 [Chrysochromulina tobinii]|eukprot:KOO22700.1 hypothetical protein Ctob_001472 [Chrysochromulina sp. CCMP291]